MKRLFFILIISVLLAALPSCTTAPHDPLAYQKGALNAEVVFEKNGTRLSALVKLGPMAETPRDAEISFSSGISAVRKNGESSLTLGQTKLTPDPKFFAICELFSLEGNIISAMTEQGSTEITLSNGEGSYDITLDRDDRPRRITGKDFTLDIIWLEIGE